MRKTTRGIGEAFHVERDYKQFRLEKPGNKTTAMRETMAQLSDPKPAYDLRPADITTDRDAILHVCSLGSLSCTSAKYHWKYERNPVRGVWCEIALESATKQVVGTTALFARRLLVDGIPFRAAVAGDFAVDPRHRTLYPAIALQRAAVNSCIEDQFDVLYAFPNDAARPIQIRAGYRAVGSLRAGVRLLHSRNLLGKHDQGRWWNGAADALDWAVAHVSRESRIRPPRDYVFRPLCAFDARFDSFWARMLKQYSTVLERTASYANWRFMDCPDKKYSLFAAVHQQTEEIGGYVVSWSRRGKTQISDIMAFDDVFDGLMAALIDSERQRGAYCLTILYLGDGSLIHRLQRFGFLFRKTSSQVLVRVNPKIPAPQRLLDAGNWYLLDGDSDC